MLPRSPIRFEETRRWWSAMPIIVLMIAGGLKADDPATKDLPDLPSAVTSFGAAIIGDNIYVYGGHMGEGHAYDRDSQAKTLYRLSLANPVKWEAIASGPHLQGLALVAYKSNLIRVGGFMAKNAPGEDHDLWSQASVERFDTIDGKWHAMPRLPEPRSSLDAMVVGDHLYVVGGWSMQGKDSESQWHKTAWRLDLKNKDATWQTIADPPFQRRALALATFKDRLFVLGGMKESGKPTRRVDIYDPKSDQWTRGPDLDGKDLAGFGCSAFATQGRLYASTIDGQVQRLSPDESKWETISTLEVGRFFHRMLPIRPGHFVLLGGANMEIGKFAEVEHLTVEP